MKDLWYRRNLPHWQPLAATFFVTTRLYGSIPMSVLKQLRAEKEEWLAAAKGNPDEIYKVHRKCFGRFDDALDNNRNAPYYLQQPEIAKIVADGLHYQDSDTYKLWTYTIMSNHIHLLITTKETNEIYLKTIMQRLKRHTAREANKVLGRTGNPFWEEESYDHIVRSEAEFYRIENYILKNPVKAKLVERAEDWAWSYRA